MAKVHRVSTTWQGLIITGQCTCGAKHIELAPSEKQFLSYWRHTRRLMERHWWVKHAKRHIYGKEWRLIAPNIPQKMPISKFHLFLHKFDIPATGR